MTLLLASIWMPDLETMRLVLPELLLVATLAVLMLAPLAVGRGARLTGWLALIGCAVAAIAAIMTFDLVGDGVALFGVEQAPITAEAAVPHQTTAEAAVPHLANTAEAAVPHGMLVADRLGMFFRLFLMIFLVGIIGMWFWFDAVRERYANEFFTLLIASALGMALMAANQVQGEIDPQSQDHDREHQPRNVDRLTQQAERSQRTYQAEAHRRQGQQGQPRAEEGEAHADQHQGAEDEQHAGERILQESAEQLAKVLAIEHLNALVSGTGDETGGIVRRAPAHGPKPDPLVAIACASNPQ